MPLDIGLEPEVMLPQSYIYDVFKEVPASAIRQLPGTSLQGPPRRIISSNFSCDVKQNSLPVRRSIHLPKSLWTTHRKLRALDGFLRFGL